MNNQEARFILGAYRPDGRDASEPRFAEALAQAVCMQTKDFRRAYEAFVAKQKPQFAGN